jgi:hypothetical protein
LLDVAWWPIMTEDGVMKMKCATIVTAVCFGIVALTGAGFYSGASASGVKSSVAPSVPQASNAFCYRAIRLVGTYSVDVEWAIGLNDGQPLPVHLTSKARKAVLALARSSFALSSRAPTALMAAQLRRLSVELRQSRQPIDVVRAEAAFGATGYPTLRLMCPSAMMIMTATNPLGGFSPE